MIYNLELSGPGFLFRFGLLFSSYAQSEGYHECNCCASTISLTISWHKRGLSVVLEVANRIHVLPQLLFVHRPYGEHASFFPLKYSNSSGVMAVL